MYVSLATLENVAPTKLRLLQEHDFSVRIHTFKECLWPYFSHYTLT